MFKHPIFDCGKLSLAGLKAFFLPDIIQRSKQGQTRFSKLPWKLSINKPVNLILLRGCELHVKNPRLSKIAEQVQAKLKTVIDSL
jgi:hypothetical protein